MRLLLPVTVFLVCCVACAGGRPQSTTAPSSSTPPAPDHGPPHFTLSASALAKEFRANPAAAGERYGGKILRVTGTVEAVDPDATNPGPFLLLGGGQKITASCVFRHAAHLEGAAVGQVVTVTGVYRPFDNETPRLYDCTFR